MDEKIMQGIALSLSKKRIEKLFEEAKTEIEKLPKKDSSDTYSDTGNKHTTA